jgi:hypothetical protein
MTYSFSLNIFSSDGFAINNLSGIPFSPQLPSQIQSLGLSVSNLNVGLSQQYNF